MPVEHDPADDVANQLPVTDRTSWIALLGVVVLLLGGLIWAVLGRAPETERGPGMIVPAHGFVDVGRDVDGFITALLVAPGDHVTAGQVVARTQKGDASADVRVPAPGNIATILERSGAYTNPGQPIMTLDPDHDAEVAVGFIPATSGAQTRPGMAALVGLAAYPESQYGTMTGVVKSVSALPATSDRIELLVGGNGSLADYFMAHGPVLEVTVVLDPNPDNPSGYNWTIGAGPDERLITGTLAEVAVVIADYSPISRILR